MKDIALRFALPASELRPFVTTYYHCRFDLSQGREFVEDYLHPEWANVRILIQGKSSYSIGPGELAPTPRLAVTGPTSRATRFRMSSGIIWGIGLLPLGWAKFVDRPAGDYADRCADARDDPALGAFAPLAEALMESGTHFESGLALIEAHMQTLLDRPLHDAGVITAINGALIDEKVATVSELAERAGMSVRSLERISRRAFGFSPKLLLRRQRFLRSLAQFMLDPTMSWLRAMDYHYHDQAHFVRDFHRFMGMSPSAYGRFEHPILRAAARDRAAIAGKAIQALHEPPQAHPE
ncbi:helix-turn-helix domain-containing protein [Altererythrobacter sp.]|uniref:helix-turn-helix domain-containing protein n=1 Tax=Altererythrobacter sp. TaxID=1872480 RepID=UPI003D13817F